MSALPVITRPSGKPYRPRKVAGHAVNAVIVLGTHDIERARRLAENCARYWGDSDCTAVNPETGWWRKGFEWGELAWIDDTVRGAAGVRFEVVEETSD